jgi:cation transport ATPase
MDDLITRRNAEPTATQPRFPGWKSYTMMSALLVFALGAAIGQHEWYNYLNGRAVNQVPIDQSWAIRVGTAFAFLFKAAAAAAVGIAFCQGFWFSVRRGAFRVNSLDAMFQVLSNPFKFFNTALILKAASLFILAILVWLLPITAVLSPGAVTGSASSLRKLNNFSNSTACNNTIPCKRPCCRRSRFLTSVS